MIPEKSDPRWKDLLTGKKNHQFKFIAAGMCVARNVRAVSVDKSPETMAKAIGELHEFFTKYEQIAKDDLKAMF